MKKLIRLMLVVLLLVAMFAGCSSTETTTASEETAQTATETEKAPATEEEAAPAEEANEETVETTGEAAEAVEEVAASDGFSPVSYTFPLVQETETLSYFTTMSPNYTGFMETYATNDSVIALEELTGVHIEYQCFIPETAQTQFNLMAASGTLPDITLGATEYYSGGMDKAVEEEVLLNLADYLDYCPNFSAILEADDDIKSSLMTNEGNLVGFAAYGDPDIAMNVNGCIMVRGDWLEKVGMDVPTTYDEVTAVLDAFKTQLDCDTPMIVTSYLDDQSGSFAAGYDIKAFFMTSPGIQVPFYVVDDVVKCAIVEDDFISYIDLLHSYMEAGYTAADIESYTNENSYQSMVTSGEVGFFWGFGVNNLNTLNAQVEEGGYFVAVPAIRKTEDQTLHFTSTSGSYQARSCVNLTTNCSNIELACKWLDCHYTEEVSMLSMYGVEGLSYEIVSGEPQYTDLILSNPQGMSMETAKAIYTLSPADNVSYNYINTDLATYSAEQIEALELINSGSMDGEYVYPNGASMTADESEEYSSLIADLSTYMAEHVLKFVVGDEDMSEYQAFIDVLYQIGMQDAIDLQQAAYDRYIGK